MSDIKIGTCGYGYFKPGKGWKDKYKNKLQAYTNSFRTGELNRTFYKLPMEKTAERWRREADNDFDFTMKAWQALTHPTSSPTWRNKKDKLTDAQKENFGYLKPNSEIVEAWNKTKRIADSLNAKIIVIQTSNSFDCNRKNKRNMRKLLKKINRGAVEIAWEPRGNWREKQGEIKKICDDLNLIHVVDLMRRNPVSDHPISYIRLHGLNEKEYDYNYDYSDEELEELSDKLKNLSEEKKTVYCMFNNFQMFKNAECLKEILK
ncbi:MAG: DUF72 domain-containing protein [Candidatus Thermoplasmatota archaeon]